jgi:hypothetical protein
MAGKVRQIHSEVGTPGVFFADALAHSKACKVFAAFGTSKKYDKKIQMNPLIVIGAWCACGLFCDSLILGEC